MILSRFLMRSVPASSLLLLPITINFAKILYAAYALPIVDFGRYSLYIGLSSALVYLFNSGLYEGHLKYFSILKIGHRSFRLSLLQVKAEIVSFVMLLLAVCISIFILFVFKPLEEIFILAMVISSHVQAHANLLTTHARVNNDLIKVGAILSIRSFLSSFFFIGLISYGGFSVWVSYLLESLALAVLFGFYLISRINFRHNLNLFSSISVIKYGVWQCYASSIRYIFFATERFVASLLLSPSAMGEYGRLMLFYQVVMVGGGVISQLVQQRILFNALFKGVKSTGILLLKYQSIIVGCAISTLIVFFALSPNTFNNCVKVIAGPNISVFGAFSIIVSGLIAGTSYIDSLALGSSKGTDLILIQTLGGIIWAIIFFALVGFFTLWSLNLQALMFLILILLLLVGNIRFVLLH